MGTPSDGHKSGKNNCLGAFPPCEADHLAARMGPSAPRDRPQGRAAPALTSELQVPPRLLANRDPAPQPYFAAEAKRPSPTASGVASFSYRSERADDGDRPVPEIQGEHLSAREGARFLVPPPSPRRSRPASINAKGPPPPAGKRAHEPMIRRPSLLVAFLLALSPCFLPAWGLTSCVCGLETRWRRWRRKSARNRSSSSP